MSATVLDRPEVQSPPEPVERKEEQAARERPSTLLRQGARYHPQGRGLLFAWKEQTTCALGALYLGALGYDYYRNPCARVDFDAVVEERTGVALGEQQVAMPGHGPLVRHCTLRLKDAIVCLNDRDGWSYERIAQWLEDRGF